MFYTCLAGILAAQVISSDTSIFNNTRNWRIWSHHRRLVWVEKHCSSNATWCFDSGEHGSIFQWCLGFSKLKKIQFKYLDITRTAHSKSTLYKVNTLLHRLFTLFVFVNYKLMTVKVWIKGVVANCYIYLVIYATIHILTPELAVSLQYKI